MYVLIMHALSFFALTDKKVCLSHCVVCASKKISFPGMLGREARGIIVPQQSANQEVLG